jgi:hypothetical protein
MRKLVNAIRWWMVKRLNVVIWALTPEPHRSNLRQIWAAQFDNFKKQDGGAHLVEMVLRQAEHTSEVGRLAAEWELYAVKEDMDPEGAEAQQAIREMRAAVKQHNKKFAK